MKLSLRQDSLRKVRENDLVPGVIYGRKIDSTPVQADAVEFGKLYRKNGTSMTFKIRLDGKQHQVYIKEVQKDPLNHNRVLHFDLIKVTASDRITADIPVHLINKAEVEARGLVVQLINDTIETEFSPGQGVSSFELDVEGLEDGDALRVKDLTVAEGLKVLEDDDVMIVNVTEPTYEDEPTEDEEAVDEDEDVEVEAIKQKGDADDEEKEEE